MTVFKNIVLSVLAPMLLLPPHLFAAGDSGIQVIKQLQITNKRVVKIWGKAGNWTNPDACNKANYIILDPGASATPNEYYSEMFVLVVSSYIQEKQISATLNGCSGNRPLIESVRTN